MSQFWPTSRFVEKINCFEIDLRSVLKWKVSWGPITIPNTEINSEQSKDDFSAINFFFFSAQSGS